MEMILLKYKKKEMLMDNENSIQLEPLNECQLPRPSGRGS